MENERNRFDNITNIQGIVIFSRGKSPVWIDPIFQLWNEN